MRKTIAGFTTAAALAAGGTVITDEAINPYEVSSEKYELRAASVVEAAGENKIEAHRDRPAVSFEKWNGEAGMTVAYAGVNAQGTRQFLTDRVEWKGEKEEVHAYPLDAKEGMEDGGFEIEVVLSERPDTNRWDFTIEGADELDFFYQPALTDEEIADGAERPENVVGSYAVYHKEKANHRVGDTNYATGKAFHIYRPKAIDANGVEEWCELGYEGGTLSVTCSEEWLESAAYPVRVDPTFGYTTAGGSTTNFLSARFYGIHTSSSDTGNVLSITGLTQSGGFPFTWKALLVEDTGDTIVSNGVGVTTFASNVLGSAWRASTFSPNPGITAQTYIIGGISSANTNTIFYDTVSNAGFEDSSNSHASPTDPTDGADNNNSYSFFATYAGACVFSGGGKTCDQFLNPGYATWTAPTGVSSADIACWGGGGGGGLVSGSGGGGGGGGGFASSTVSVTAGNTYGIHIANGGETDSTGFLEPSNFASTTVMAASGWSTGTATGAIGAPTASSTGDVVRSGGNGGTGNTTGDIGGGGGGAGGSHGNGGNGANGASGVGGGGGGGNGGSNGSGATGGSSTNGGAGGNGGNGSRGVWGTSHHLGGGGGGGGDDAHGGAPGGFWGGGGGGGESFGGRGGAGACIVVYTAASTDLLETLTDNFDDNSLDSGKWLNWGGGNVVETNQRIEVTTNSTSGISVWARRRSTT